MNTPMHKSLLFGYLLFLTASCGTKSSIVAIGSPPAGPVIALKEIEVNDFAWSANNVGLVYAGDKVAIQGSITDLGWDPRDGFRFVAAEPLLVNVSLNGQAPGSDLDWCVWDPDIGAYTACQETEFNPEVGSFLVLQAGKEFQLVVSSYFGTTNYSLLASFSPFYGATTEGAIPQSGDLTLRSDPKALFGKDNRWQRPSLESELLQDMLPFVPQQIPQTGAIDGSIRQATKEALARSMSLKPRRFELLSQPS